MADADLAELLSGATGPTARPGPRAPGASEAQRTRLLIAAVQAVAERGYAGTTVAHVVARARVSRRTFYEHFADKEECFVASFDRAAEIVFDTVAEAIGPHEHWMDRLRAGIQAYVFAMTAAPAMTRAFHVELAAAGPEALGHRRAVIERWGGLVAREVSRARTADATLRELSVDLTPELALALVGALDAIVMVAVEDPDHDRERLIEAAVVVWLGLGSSAPRQIAPAVLRHGGT